MKNIKEYDISIKSDNTRLSFSEYSSNLTRLTLNLMTSAFSFKSILTIAYPKQALNILPIFTILYTDTFKKDILVISTKDRIKQHIRNFQNVFVQNEPLNKRITLLKESPNRRKFLEYGFEAETSLNPKNAISDTPNYNVLFSDDPMALDASSIEDERYLGKKNLFLTKVELDIGLVIIEEFNARFFSTNEYNAILSLINALLKKGKKVLLHFSNPYSQYIELLNKDIQSLVLMYNSAFFIDNKSKLYNLSWEKYESKQVNVYELDSPANYVLDFELLESTYSGNLDYYYDLYNRIKRDNWQLLKDHYSLINKMDSRFRELYNLSIHPSGYIFDIEIDGEFTCYTIDNFINFINDTYAADLPGEVGKVIQQLSSKLYSFYLELKQTRGYFDKETKTAPSKNLILLTALKDQDIPENNNKKYTFLVRNRHERPQLYANIKNLGLKHVWLDNISILKFDNLINADPDSLLFVSGCLYNVGNLSIIFNNFHEITFCTYKGINEHALREEIEKYSKDGANNKLRKYFSELFKELKISEKIPEYMKVKEVEISVEQALEQKKDEMESNIDLIPTSSDMNASEIIITPKQNKELKIVFKEIKTGKKKIRAYSKDHRLLVYNSEYGYELKKVKYLKIGNLVLNTEEDRDGLDFFCETYGWNTKVDIDAIHRYYRELLKFIDSGNSAESFYKKYCQFAEKPKSIGEFRLWLNQSVIGPELAQDIFALGKAGNIEHLINFSNYIYDQIEKVRVNHQLMGKRLKKVVNALTEDKNFAPESFEDMVLRNIISLYEIVEIRKLKKTSSNKPKI